MDLARSSGGAETRVVDTAKGLHDRGHEVAVVCLKGSRLADAVRQVDVPVLAVARSKKDPRLVFALRRLLREHDGWVVDVHNAQSQLAVHLAGRGRLPSGRLVATIHSEYRESERRPLGFSAHEAVLRRTIRSGWRLVAVTTSVRRNLEELGAATGDIDVIWSGIAGRRCAAAAGGSTVREQLGLRPHDFLVVAVGRMVAVKNFQLAIRAIHQLHNTLPAARLLLVGDGPERPKLEQLARDLSGPSDLVRFAGHRDDVPDLLTAADAMVITSTTEGLPYVLLEAAAARTPVVSTRVGAMAEVFGDGAVAFIAAGAEKQPAGAQLVADELLSLARSPSRRELMVARAEALQRDRLSLSSMLTATLRTYHLTSGPQPEPTPITLEIKA
ncbi:glycosyltransferase family 4 protein [Humibacillus xanthopallidus]|uniref:glycosyltransferase family 4 protein n=1 Tax=Humibacillus xanthopallidus TaxID=412689 RepID=UPI001150786C|nr:glycosyltransferase family 4 protein [Humibacillus xanthopallidus]